MSIGVRVFCLGLLVLVPQCCDGDEQSLDFVERLAKRIEQNQAAIITWQGTVQIFDRYEDGATGRATATFAIDVAKGKKRWTFRGYGRQKPGERPPTICQHLKSVLLDSAEQTTFQADRPMQPAQTGWVAVVHPPRAEVLNLHADDFDPFMVFSEVFPDVPRNLRFLRGLNDLAGARFHVQFERRGDCILATLASKPPDGASETTTFSLKSGGNITECIRDNESVSAMQRFAFDEVDGVFVPNRYDFEKFRGRCGLGHIMFARSFEFTNLVVNGQIDPTEFSLAAMGLESGDIVDDRIRGVRRRYEPVRAASAAPVSKPGAVWLFIAILAGTVFVAATSEIWKRRSQ